MILIIAGGDYWQPGAGESGLARRAGIQRALQAAERGALLTQRLLRFPASSPYIRKPLN